MSFRFLLGLSFRFAGKFRLRLFGGSGFLFGLGLGGHLSLSLLHRSLKA